MNLLHCVYLILIGIGAAFVQRVCGFGMGIFSMVFFPHFLPTHTAGATISSLFSCGSSTYKAIRYRKHIVFRMVLPMACTALVTIPIAVRFAAVVSGRVFQLLIGSALIALSLFFLFFSRRIQMKPTIGNGLLAGTLSGVLSGLFSTGGPPAVLYLTNATDDKTVYFATLQLYFCFTNVYATSMRIFNGMVTKDVLIYAAVGMIGCAIGDCIGRKVFDKLDSQKLRMIIYIVMILSGVAMFF